MKPLLYDFPGSICCQMTRVVLAEKGVAYDKRTVDITGDRSEQFDPWYLEINPSGVVPTLSVGDEIITNTLQITPYINTHFEGPELLENEALATEWMAKIMAPHFGVLLYSAFVDENGKCATVVARHDHLVALRDERGDATGILQKRIDSNIRFQSVLADPEEIARHIDGTKSIVADMERGLSESLFLAGEYSIADAFAAAALARFESHGYSGWWADLPAVTDYYARLQARPSWSEAGVQNAVKNRG